jgi:hypothetical protein
VSVDGGSEEWRSIGEGRIRSIAGSTLIDMFEDWSWWLLLILDDDDDGYCILLTMNSRGWMDDVVVEELGGSSFFILTCMCNVWVRDLSDETTHTSQWQTNN